MDKTPIVQYLFLMGILRTLGAIKEQRFENPSIPISTYIENLLGINGGAGVVNKDKAWRVSGFYTIGKIISETLASLQFDLLNYDDKKNFEPALKDPLYSLVTKPNPDITRFTLFETIQFHATMLGNGYAFIHRNNAGRATRLDLMDSDNVKPIRSKEGRLWYEYTVKGKKEYFKNTDIFHVKAMSYNGDEGLSPIDVLRESLGIAKNSKEYLNEFYKNGTMLSGVIEMDEILEDDVLKRLRGSWNKNNAGSSNGGVVAILEQGMKFKALKLNPVDEAFLKIVDYTDRDFAKANRVPLYMVGGDSPTNNNIEHQGIEFKQYCMGPWVKRWEHELNSKLVPSNKPNQKFRFNLDSLLRADSQGRSNILKTMFFTKSITPNEIRKMNGMNQSEAEGMDDFYSPVNMTTDPNFLDNKNEDGNG